MREHEYLLTVLAEECAEVAHRASKAVRFGLDDVQDNHPDGEKLTAAQRLKVEMIDLLAVWGMLCQRGMVTPLALFDDNAIQRKQDRVMELMDYSRERGTLEG